MNFQAISDSKNWWVCRMDEVWVNYNDLTATSLEMMVNKGHCGEGVVNFGIDGQRILVQSPSLQFSSVYMRSFTRNLFDPRMVSFNILIGIPAILGKSGRLSAWFTCAQRSQGAGDRGSSRAALKRGPQPPWLQAMLLQGRFLKDSNSQEPSIVLLLAALKSV